MITKSGTNELAGSAHYFGQWDEIAAPFPAARGGGRPDFHRNQAGATLGGPLVRDRAFFFLAYDQQAAAETKQATRHVRSPANLQRLERFLQARWPGLFDDEFGPIRRTDDARSLLAKLDLNLDGRHQASIKYNYTWAEQANGTFDVDSWGASANGIEGGRSHAINGSLRSLLTNALSNEVRVQAAREDRPRWYRGPLLPGALLPGPPQFAALGGRPFPDITMDFADGFRLGLPFFLPIDPSFDTRLQVVDNVSFATGNHLVKAGVEYNPHPRRAAVHRAGEQPLHLRFGRGLHRIRHARQPLRHVLGRIGRRVRGLSPGLGGHRPGPAIPAVGDRAARPPPSSSGRQQFPHARARRVRAGHVASARAGDAGPRAALGRRLAPERLHRAGRDVLRAVLGDPRFPLRRPDSGRPRQPAAPASAGVGPGRRRPHGAARQHRVVRGPHPDAGLRAAPDDQRRLPADPLSQQRGVGAGAGPRDRRADRHLGGAAVPPGHPGRRPATWSCRGPGRSAPASTATWAGGSPPASTTSTRAHETTSSASSTATTRCWARRSGLGRTRTRAASTRSPLPRAAPARATTRSRPAARGGAGSAAARSRSRRTTRWRSTCSDDDNERDPFTLRYAHAGNLAPEYGWSDRDRRHQVRRVRAGHPARRGAAEQRRPLRVPRRRPPSSAPTAARGPPSRRTGSCADGSIPRAQHAAAGERVLHVGPAAVAPVRARRRHRHRADLRRSST